jgi:hypothetical protein
MNYTFSLSPDNLVVETRWLGDLTREIIAAGVVSRMNWIHDNSDTIPRIQFSDYRDANLKDLSASDLKMIATMFRGIDDQFPGAHWISVMNTD